MDSEQLSEPGVGSLCSYPSLDLYEIDSDEELIHLPHPLQYHTIERDHPSLSRAPSSSPSSSGSSSSPTNVAFDLKSTLHNPFTLLNSTLPYTVTVQNSFQPHSPILLKASSLENTNLQTSSLQKISSSLSYSKLHENIFRRSSRLRKINSFYFASPDNSSVLNCALPNEINTLTSTSLNKTGIPKSASLHNTNLLKYVTSNNTSMLKSAIPDSIHSQQRYPSADSAMRNSNVMNNLSLLKSSVPYNSTISEVSSTNTAPFLIPVHLRILPLTMDNLPKLIDSPYDRYGFKKVSINKSISTEEYNNWLSQYTPYLGHRLDKWTDLMRSSGLLVTDGISPTRFPPKSGRTKKLIRRGIPAEWRGNAWFFYAGGQEKLHNFPNLYHELVAKTENRKTKDTEVIERDLHRTFPDNYYFNASLLSPGHQAPCETGMITSLRRVLTAFAHYQPHIGYCQSLNFLAGLLLIFMDEERAFWLLVILTERIIPKVHSADLEGVHTDQGVLMLCIKEYIPLLWLVLGKTFEGERLSEDKILTSPPPVTLVTSSWFMSLFIGNLPIECVLRVWDILWYEGSKTIFRISLTIAKKCFDGPEFQAARLGLGGESEQIELFQLMQQFPKTLLDPNDLIALCFKKIGGYGFGSLSQLEINNCREFVASQREKMSTKRALGISSELTASERQALLLLDPNDQNAHDVYGFSRSIMRSTTWNKIVADKMKRKFSRKSEL